MAKEKTAIPASLAALQAAIKAEHDATSAKQTSMATMNAALRGTVMAMIDHTAASNDFDGASMVRLYYSAEDLTKMSKSSAKSRTADWNIAIDAARANPVSTKAIWPTAAEAEAAELPNTTRAKFLVGCGIIKKSPSTPPAAVLKVMHEKSNGMFKMPDVSKANDGDLLALIKACGLALYERHADTFADFQDSLLAIQSTFNAGQKEGKYLTTEQRAKLTPENVVEMKPLAA